MLSYRGPSPAQDSLPQHLTALRHGKRRARNSSEVPGHANNFKDGAVLWVAAPFKPRMCYFSVGSYNAHFLATLFTAVFIECLLHTRYYHIPCLLQSYLSLADLRETSCDYFTDERIDSEKFLLAQAYKAVIPHQGRCFPVGRKAKPRSSCCVFGKKESSKHGKVIGSFCLVPSFVLMSGLDIEPRLTWNFLESQTVSNSPSSSLSFSSTSFGSVCRYIQQSCFFGSFWLLFK